LKAIPVDARLSKQRRRLSQLERAKIHRAVEKALAEIETR
jgi:hypothetical protein